MSKKRSLQIAEAEIERLREAYAALNGRAEELEEMARTRLLLTLPDGSVISDATFEFHWLRQKYAGGDVIALHHFSGKVIIKEG